MAGTVANVTLDCNSPYIIYDWTWSTKDAHADRESVLIVLSWFSHRSNRHHQRRRRILLFERYLVLFRYEGCYGQYHVGGAGYCYLWV